MQIVDLLLGGILNEFLAFKLEDQKKKMHKKGRDGNSLVVQWLGLHALTAKVLGLIL